MKKKVEEQKRRKASVEEREKERQLHFMKCPKCGTSLIEIDFKEIKIDECPECRGMWLDAGEFDAVSRIEKPTLQRLFNIFRK
jgi:hypothetical protein